MNPIKYKVMYSSIFAPLLLDVYLCRDRILDFVNTEVVPLDILFKREDWDLELLLGVF
jgi:hypothetical protein